MEKSRPLHYFSIYLYLYFAGKDTFLFFEKAIVPCRFFFELIIFEINTNSEINKIEMEGFITECLLNDRIEKIKSKIPGNC
jgi:hypothetical protein